VTVITITGSEILPNVFKQQFCDQSVDSVMAETVNDIFLNGLDEEQYSR